MSSWKDVIFIAGLPVRTAAAERVMLGVLGVGRVVIRLSPRIGLQAGLEVWALPSLHAWVFHQRLEPFLLRGISPTVLLEEVEPQRQAAGEIGLGAGFTRFLRAPGQPAHHH